MRPNSVPRNSRDRGRVGAYLTNRLTDARLQQHSDGTIPDVVPVDADTILAPRTDVPGPRSSSSLGCANAATTSGQGSSAPGFLLKQLTENGYGDVALDILLQQDAPSWLDQVERGATTVRESWTGVDEQGNPELSYDHYSWATTVQDRHARLEDCVTTRQIMALDGALL